MSQVYHSNAKLNQHLRERIQYSSLSNIELATIHSINEKTIGKKKGEKGGQATLKSNISYIEKRKMLDTPHSKTDSTHHHWSQIIALW